MPLLSLVLCSRNDDYGGNARWRIETALNYLALQAHRLGRLAEIEVVVSDWGSSTPLRCAVTLTRAAASITRFLETPAELAQALQKDSPFAEVLANNAAIRRASGTYIGRIDQDTLVGSGLLERCLNYAGGKVAPFCGIESGFLFCGRRAIPFDFARRSPQLDAVDAFVKRYGRMLSPEGLCQRPFFDAPVGLVLLHRAVWHHYRGYDERLLYWGFMETDLALRMAGALEVVNLEPFLGRDLYHLGHSPRRICVTTRRKNPRRYPSDRVPNSSAWGLAAHHLELRYARAADNEADPSLHDSTSTGSLIRYFPAVMLDSIWNAGLGAGRLVRGVLRGDRIVRA